MLSVHVGTLHAVVAAADVVICWLTAKEILELIVARHPGTKSRNKLEQRYSLHAFLGNMALSGDKVFVEAVWRGSSSRMHTSCLSC